ncbi:2-succinyl-5-enolpyruvyl-6-hydroxy-3-cyclohexene-1-carboxylic-acid synthase [Aureisphaera galaxeae]|nr:2-succinyl-5-enolpyruvyl-6-hydroxy-3-cyclohexene-1-carboxylic-acid synthase [Aureisphaera galaxeae]MDC8004635.1 2-succinyl-5-enolpyruvyl-6-hydroxy-3-cyclohexene-1-carboxylic-acid synthase [Aureisphaera galaxeae]
MNFSKKILSQTVTQICLSAGVDHIVISPGSRNAPLTIGFTQHPDFKCYSIVDERCAGFFAMGMAQQLKRPVALVCTSGSALLNYYPAVAEAFYSNIPLVVISADRPKELIDVGDGQTIRQENVYDNHILYSANCKEGQEFQSYNEEEIGNALTTALRKEGPVHINVPFSEPLYEIIDEPTISLNRTQWTSHFQQDDSREINPTHYKEFISDWNGAQRKMILVGTLPPNEVGASIIELLGSDDGVMVFTETTSNLHHEHFFPSIDKIIMRLEEADFDALKPDMLLTFGGMVVSKKIKAFLRKYQPQAHYHVGPHQGYDTFFCLKHHFEVAVNDFFDEFKKDYSVGNGGYREFWLKVKQQRARRHEEYLGQIPFSDLTVHSLLYETLPNNVQLQLANSATVRYSQLFDLNPTFEVFCNRGTSGIDGSTSTAIGAAHISNKQTVFITGDLSFFYDSNALWNDHIPNNFRMIVLNNSGGGIFRILPKAKDAQHFEQYFETQHGLTGEHLATMFGFNYVSASDEVSLREVLQDFYKDSDTPRILEIFTPTTLNDEVLIDYFKFIS